MLLVLLGFAALFGLGYYEDNKMNLVGEPKLRPGTRQHERLFVGVDDSSFKVDLTGSKDTPQQNGDPTEKANDPDRSSSDPYGLTSPESGASSHSLSSHYRDPEYIRPEYRSGRQNRSALEDSASTSNLGSRSSQAGSIEPDLVDNRDGNRKRSGNGSSPSGSSARPTPQARPAPTSPNSEPGGVSPVDAGDRALRSTLPSDPLFQGSNPTPAQPDSNANSVEPSAAPPALNPR